MALYREGKAAMAADGTVTGTGTKWQSSLSLIRPGATIMFLSSPIKMAVVNKVVSDTEIKAITTNGAVVASTDYAILLSDSLTVDGLAQDVAETLRYYQSQETVIADAVEFFKEFDFESLQNLANQIKADSEASESSAAAAAASESKAKTSEDNAKSSENAAKNSEVAAETTRDQIQQIIDNAGDQSTLVVLAQPDGFDSIGRVSSFAALRNLKPKKSGQHVLLTSYYDGWAAENKMPTGGGEFISSIGTATDDGGYIAAGPGYYWTRVVNNNSFTAEDFGCKTTATPPPNFNVLPAELFDNTAMMQAAFNLAISKSFKLNLSAGTYYFESSDTLRITGPIHIEGRPGTVFYHNPSNKANPKTDAFMNISGCSMGRISSINCFSNSYLGKGINFDRSVGDNRKLVLEHVYVDTFRWGFYVGEPECINQIEFHSCRAQSNYFQGIFIESFKEGQQYGHSAPVHFFNTICNGNGPTSFALGATYKTTKNEYIKVMDSVNDVGCQAYFQGLSNVQYIGGQLSGHGSPRNTSLATITQCNSFIIYGTDLEDINGFTTDGTAITADNIDTIESNYLKDISGAAIVVSSCLGFKIDSPHIFKINTLSTIKLMNNTYNYEIGGFTPDEALKYNVWDANGLATNRISGVIHPRLVNSRLGINSVAFDNMSNKLDVSSLIHNETSQIIGLTPSTGSNVPHTRIMWSNGAMYSSTDLNNGFRLNYLSNHNEPLTPMHLYNEFSVSEFGGSVTESNALDEIKCIFIQTTYANSGDGRFIIQALDASGSVLSSNWYSPQSFNSTFPISGFVRFDVPTGAKKIRYGFVNSANYTGSLRSHFMSGFAYNKRFFLKIYAVYNDLGRYGQFEPPYSVAIDRFRVGDNTTKMPSIPASSATDVAGVNEVINSLLASLKANGFMSS